MLQKLILTYYKGKTTTITPNIITAALNIRYQNGLIYKQSGMHLNGYQTPSISLASQSLTFPGIVGRMAGNTLGTAIKVNW